MFSGKTAGLPPERMADVENAPGSNSCQAKLQTPTRSRVNQHLLGTCATHAACSRAVGAGRAGAPGTHGKGSRDARLGSSHSLSVLWVHEGQTLGRPGVPGHVPAGRLLTDHGAVDQVELVATQQGLAAQLLQLLVAAVVGPAAPGGGPERRGFTAGGPGEPAGGPGWEGLTCLLPWTRRG